MCNLFLGKEETQILLNLAFTRFGSFESSPFFVLALFLLFLPDVLPHALAHQRPVIWIPLPLSPIFCDGKTQTRKAANAGALTSFEVLDILGSRGTSKDPTRVIVPVVPSEFKVYDYLVETAASNPTRGHINECLEKRKKYGLSKAEVLSIINFGPSTLVEIDPADTTRMQPICVRKYGCR